jgi:hypothetical protein
MTAVVEATLSSLLSSFIGKGVLSSTSETFTCQSWALVSVGEVKPKTAPNRFTCGENDPP